MDNRTQVLYETAFKDVQEALGMRGYVFNGNAVHTHKEVINLGVYKFCASMYFLMGKGVIEQIMPCGIEKLEVRREWIQGIHTIKHSYEKGIIRTCVFSHVTKKHKVSESKTEYTPQRNSQNSWADCHS